MGNLLAYSGIATKVRAMEAKLLWKEDFEKIAAMKSVPEVVSWLIQNSTYKEVLENLDPGLIHRGNIERRSTVSAAWSRENSCGCI